MYGIGDLILGTPLFSSIRKIFPDSQITVVLRADLPADVLDENPDIFRILHYPQASVLYFFPKIPIGFRNFTATIKDLINEMTFIFKLRKCRFDMSMWLLPGGLSGWPLVSFLSNAKIRVGPEYIHWMRIWKWCFTHRIIWDNHRHAVENNLDNLRKIGNDGFETALKLFIKSDNRQSAYEFLEKYAVRPAETLVGIHSGGGNRSRSYWPEDRFILIAKDLIKRPGYRVAVFFGPQEPQAIAAFNEVPIIPVVNLTFGAVCGIIEKCSLFISSDTGLGHAAAALQVPTLTLFGNANPKKHHHWGNKNYAINKLSESCIPSVVTGYSAGNTGKKALESITVEEVISTIDSIVSELSENKKRSL
jgi:ADP-heptose:LPS heptosyltransferase